MIEIMDKVDTVGKKTLEIFTEAEGSGPGVGSSMREEYGKMTNGV